jgi:hypothetical protein
MELQNELNSGNIDENQYVAQLNDDTYNFFKQQSKEAPNKIGEQDFILRGQGLVDQNYLESQFFANKLKGEKRISEADKMFDGIVDTFSYETNLNKGIESLTSVQSFVENDGYIDPGEKEKLTPRYKNKLATSYLDASIASGKANVISKAKDEFLNHEYLKTELTQDQRRSYAAALDAALDHTKENSLRGLLTAANNYGASIDSRFGGLTSKRLSEAQALVQALSTHADKDEARQAIAKITGAVDDYEYEKTLPFRIVSKRDASGKVIASGLDVIDPAAGTAPDETINANQALQRAENRERVRQRRIELASKDPSRYTQLANRATEPGTQAHIKEQQDLGIMTPKWFSNEQEKFYIDTLRNGTVRDLIAFEQEYPEGAIPFLRQVAEEKGGEAVGSELNRVHLAALLPGAAGKSAVMDLRLNQLVQASGGKNSVDMEKKSALKALEKIKVTSALSSQNPQLVNALSEAVAAVKLQEGISYEKAAEKVLEGTAVARVNDPWFKSRQDSFVYLPKEAVPYEKRVSAFMEGIINTSGDSKKEAASLLGLDEDTYDDLVSSMSMKVSPDNTGLIVVIPDDSGRGMRPLAKLNSNGLAETVVFKFEDMKGRTEGNYREFINFQLNLSQRSEGVERERVAKTKAFNASPKIQSRLTGKVVGKRD